MNHDFLLKTETGINAAQSTQNQVAGISEGSDKSDKNQLFSAELGKQIDKRDLSIKTTQQGEASAEDVKNTNSTIAQKTEKQLNENGKLLPTDSEVVEIFVDQLLSDVDANPALKQELTQAIEQFVETFLNEEESEQTFEDSLTALISQLVKVTSGQNISEDGQIQPIKKGVNVREVTDFPLTAAAQEKIKNILSGITNPNSDVTDPAAKVISTVSQTTDKSTQLKPTQLVTKTEPELKVINANSTAASSISSGPIEKAAGQQSALTNQPALAPTVATQKAEKVSGLTEQVERAQTVLQQIKAVILKDVSNDSPQKTDRASRIADLVKKIIPEKTTTINKAQTSLNEQGQQTVSKDAASSSSNLAQLRADILQALPAKPLASASTLEAKVVENTPILNTKPEVMNSEDKRTERLLQLVDLIKPAKEEASARPATIDRATPTVLTSAPTTTTSPLTKSEAPTLDIQPALQSKAWNRVLSSRVVWMASEGIQQAALKLNPANLGPVEVRLHLQNEQASVSFIAHNAATRDALEQALPRLRESFVENGLELTDADVSDQASQEPNEDGSQNNNNKDSQGNDVTARNGHETGPEEAVTDVKQENELGVNVYA